MHNNKSYSIPHVGDGIPPSDKRLELFRLDAEQIMKFVTPGFGMFTSRFTDDMLVSFFRSTDIDKYQKNVPSNLRYFFLMRAVWNQILAADERWKWEEIAAEDSNFNQLKKNESTEFDRILNRELKHKLYEQSTAYSDVKSRKDTFKRFFTEKYEIDLETISDSPFERTLNLLINIDYSESVTSPHAVQLMKVFLGIEHFVNRLIETDKNKAIELLRQTVNYNPQKTNYLLPMLKKLLPKSNDDYLEEVTRLITFSTVKLNKNDETLNYQQLAFYPLFVLEKLLCQFSIGMVGLEKAVEFRHHVLKLGVMDFVLECLSHFTHQSHRFGKLRSWHMPLPQYSVRFSSEKAINLVCETSQEKQQEKKKEESYFAKGTGYGSGACKQAWNMDEHLQKIRYDDDHVACLLQILRAFIKPPNSVGATNVGNVGASTLELNISGGIPIGKEFAKLLFRSSLRGVIKSYLMSDSLLEITKNTRTYHAAFQLLVALSNSPTLSINIYEFFADDEVLMATGCGAETVPNETLNKATVSSGETRILPFDLVFNTNNNGRVEYERQKIIALLNSFGHNIDEYLRRIAPELNRPISPFRCPDFFTAFFDFGFGETKQKSKSEEGELQSLSSICRAVVDVFKKHDHISDSLKVIIDLNLFMESQKNLPSDGKPGPSNTPSMISTDPQKYCESLKELQFASISFERDNISHHFIKATSSKPTAASSNSRLKRIAREIYSLRSGLILSHSSSAFVRSSEENMDLMKVLITGPEDTPYSNGCFEFDFFFPVNFPTVPPQVNLETTGRRSVRFNPNLYNCGKVCLSILGTWSGRPEEQWNAESSSLLQVITSIQSLILVKDPYFNEPGYEKAIKTPQGELASNRYNANIQIQTVKWAMIEQLRHPSKGFEEIIRLHFWLKRDEIIEQIRKWIQQWNERRGQDSRISYTIDELEKNLTHLQNEFELLRKLNLDRA